MHPVPAEHVRLAPLTTLGVGGPARWYAEARTEADVAAACEWARRRGVPLYVLGGGSNVVVGDQGVEALVLRIGLRGLEMREEGAAALVTAAAGEPWDPLVEAVVARGWAGLECLSGIPGLVGATPIQNVGAYGQEVSETVVEVRAFDRRSARPVVLSNRDCAFTYRDSLFKSGEPDRYVILAVTYRLRRDGAPTVRYADVQRDLQASGRDHPTLADVRRSVLAIRRSKSMVIEPGDENHRSCGSFFTNPVVSAADADRVQSLAGEAAMPRWPQPDGRVKLAAAWLIERAGFRRGYRDGPVGLSTRHTLAIVAHDGAQARDVVRLARAIQAAVERRFGVRLTPEPVFWGI
jgi:UDP-N-acetylmuramate dehydrogenase